MCYNGTKEVIKMEEKVLSIIDILKQRYPAPMCARLYE